MNASVCPPGDQASAGRPPAGSMSRTLPVVISSAGAASSVKRIADTAAGGCRHTIAPATSPVASAPMPTIAAGVTHDGFGDRATVPVASSAAAGACASCRSSRTSAIWCRRSRGSLVRQRAIRRRTAGGVAAGSARHSGSLASTFARTSGTSSPPNARRPASISTARNRRPRCQRADRPACPAPAPGSF